MSAMSLLLCRATLCVVLAMAAPIAVAQSLYPSRPIKLVGPYPPQSPDEFAAMIAAEQPLWAKAIKDSGAKVD